LRNSVDGTSPISASIGLLPSTKWVVAAAAAETLVTGVVTVIRPSLFCQLILGAELSASGPALGRLAGIAMLGAGLVAWPAPE
jgi:hypothetical protein